MLRNFGTVPPAVTNLVSKCAGNSKENCHKVSRRELRALPSNRAICRGGGAIMAPPPSLIRVKYITQGNIDIDKQLLVLIFNGLIACAICNGYFIQVVFACLIVYAMERFFVFLLVGYNCRRLSILSLVLVVILSCMQLIQVLNLTLSHFPCKKYLLRLECIVHVSKKEQIYFTYIRL